MFLIALLSHVARGQDSTPRAFEVASIKPLGPPILKPGEVLGLTYAGNRVSGRTQLFPMIQDAYSLAAFQIVAPNLGHDMYLLDAIMPEGFTEKTAGPLFRTLLAERFGLRFHRENKDLPAYVLTEAANGRKPQAVDPQKAREQTVDTPGGRRKGISSAGGRGHFIATAVTMDDLAANLGRILDRPVVDQTGRAGFYAMDLRWDPDDPMTLVPLLQRQLGLRLERRTLSFEMFVVDHIDQVPKEN